MTGTPQWVRWARASLLCALAGHLVANALLDEGQYVRAGLEYTWRASFPAVIQAIVILAIAAALGPASRRLDRSRRGTPMRGSLTVFATSQVLLFLTLELTERLIQRQPFIEGLFASGFTVELVLALACAWCSRCAQPSRSASSEASAGTSRPSRSRPRSARSSESLFRGGPWCSPEACAPLRLSRRPLLDPRRSWRDHHHTCSPARRCRVVTREGVSR